MFVSGKPRAGKTWWAFTKLLVNEIRTSKRFIVTNISVDLEELAGVLHEDYGETYDLRHRVRMLNENETGRFWLHPAPGVDITATRSIGEEEGEEGAALDVVEQKKKKKKPLVVPDFSCVPDPGTLFLIDECHVFFSARRWQRTGDDCLYYCSQHAKLTHDVILISQNLKQVDSQLRELAQEYHYLRNHSKERQWLGLMKRRGSSAVGCI